MPMMTIELSERNRRKLEEISRRTGRNPEEVILEMVDNLKPEDELAEQQKLEAWRDAALNVAGIWRDRRDIPELMARMRKEMDRIGQPEET